MMILISTIRGAIKHHTPYNNDETEVCISRCHLLFFLPMFTPFFQLDLYIAQVLPFCPSPPFYLRRVTHIFRKPRRDSSPKKLITST